MSNINKIVSLTKKLHEVDPSKTHNIFIDGQDQLNFYSDDNFDWFAEGVFIYDPELEADADIEYIPKGISQLYEFKDEPVKIYIRKDYSSLMPQNYCIEDVEDETEPLYVHFIIKTKNCK